MKAKKIRNILKGGERNLSKYEHNALLKKGIIEWQGSETQFTTKGLRQFKKIQAIAKNRALRK